MGIAERKERERDLQQKMRRKQILDAAKRLFHAKGFTAATIEDIAQEAELSPAAIYLYFKNKDDLYVSLNLQLLEYLSDRLERLRLQEGLNAEEKVEALKDLLYDVYNFDPLILINVFHLQASGGLKNLPPERLSQLNELAGKSLRSWPGYLIRERVKAALRITIPLPSRTLSGLSLQVRLSGKRANG